MVQRAEPPPGCVPLGYAGLIAHYKLDCPPPRRSLALAASASRSSVVAHHTEWLLLPRGSAIQLPRSPIDHLGIALKHEGVDLRILSRLFAAGIGSELTDWIRAKPKGIHARRAWFLYEWLTGDTLPIDPPRTVRYVPVLDPTAYFTRTPERSARHKVDNNLPGTAGFCPLVRRTERLAENRLAGLKVDARSLVRAADPAVLRRATAYMLLNESKGSFGIEGEAPTRTRLERWGAVIAAAGRVTLSIPELERLQRSLFDTPVFGVQLGLRKDGGFVGRHDRTNQTPIPDHISARPDDLAALMGALLKTFKLLEADGFDAVLTAAVVGFGFVFIHPFEDGNGRLHRFMLQKALIDGGFNPEGIVLPISAAILDDLAGYKAVLEEFSLPALEAMEWRPTPKGNVEVLNETAYLYRYFDATRQAEYLTDCIERTIRFALPNELRYLQQFDEAKRRIADLVDLPDRLVSLLIQFCVQNAGSVSVRKRREFFSDMPDALMAALEQAVRDTGIVPAAAVTGTVPVSP